MASTPEKSKALNALLILALAVMPLFILYATIHISGPSWDMIVRELNGRTLLNYLNSGVNPKAAFLGEFLDNRLYYFEPYREPLTTPIFALLLLFFSNPTLPYIVLIYLVYLFMIYKFAKELKLDMLVCLAVMVNTYLVYFLFIPNGGEGLAAISLILGIIYLLKKNSLSGLFFGLAGLAKYPAIVAFPLVFLLRDKKKTAKALVLEIIPLLIWGGIDYFLYGVPFYSFIESIYASGAASSFSIVYLQAILQVLAYPIAFGALCLFLFVMLKPKRKLKFTLDYSTKVFLSFIVLAAIGYVAILPHDDPTTQARYGFILCLSLLIPITTILNRSLSKRSEAIKYLIAFAMLAVLIYALYSVYTLNNTLGTSYYNPDNANNLYSQVGNALNAAGFGNCRFISNAWIPMIYSGYDSYSPFILYSSRTITPIAENIIASYGLNYSGPGYHDFNYTEYVREQMEYPIIIFKYTGVSENFVLNINTSKIVYDEQNFSIYLPQNATCYRN